MQLETEGAKRKKKKGEKRWVDVVRLEGVSPLRMFGPLRVLPPSSQGGQARLDPRPEPQDKGLACSVALMICMYALHSCMGGFFFFFLSFVREGEPAGDNPRLWFYRRLPPLCVISAPFLIFLLLGEG